MLNPLYYSDHVKPAFKGLRLLLTVSGRCLKILFTRNRQLILVEFDYEKELRFKESLLIIRYQFKNAILYNFMGIRKTTDAGIIVLNMSNLRTKPVTLTVYGFLRKKTFLIDIKPELHLQGKTFHTSIRKPQNLRSCLQSIQLKNISPKTSLSKLTIQYPSTIKSLNNIRVVNEPYNQTQFL